MKTVRKNKKKRRNGYRISTEINVEWEASNGRKRGTISDFNANGCFVMCSGEVEEREKVKIFFLWKDDKKIQFSGEVVNRFDEIGFAAKFIELNKAQKDFLEKFGDTLKVKNEGE